MTRAAKPVAPTLFRRLAAETEESAAVSLFLDLCRGSAALRHWLWEDFARDAAKRERFAGLLKRAPRKLARFADLNALSDGRGELLQHVRNAADLTAEFSDPKRRRAVLGHPDWWKLNVLLYILRHPASAYPARELQAHLAGMNIRVTARDIRRFCARCGIRRDARAGRPRGARTRRPMHPAA